MGRGSTDRGGDDEAWGSSRRSRGAEAYLTSHQSPVDTPGWRLAPKCRGSRMELHRSDRTQAPLPASELLDEVSHWATLSGSDEAEA